MVLDASTCVAPDVGVEWPRRGMPRDGKDTGSDKFPIVMFPHWAFIVPLWTPILFPMVCCFFVSKMCMSFVLLVVDT